MSACVAVGLGLQDLRHRDVGFMDDSMAGLYSPNGSGPDQVYFVKLRWTCSALNLNTVGGWFLVLLFAWFIS